MDVPGRGTVLSRKISARGVHRAIEMEGRMENLLSSAKREITIIE